MSEIKIQPWIAIKEYIDDEYREIVVEIALRHLPNASRDLRKFAKLILSKAIAVPGFRTFTRVPINIACHHAKMAFLQDPLVATVIVCLWAEAQQGYINDIRTAAEESEFYFDPDWSWPEAAKGYCDYDDLPEFHEFTNNFLQDVEPPEKDHFMLASLWLSRALLDELPLDEEVAPQKDITDEYAQLTPSPATKQLAEEESTRDQIDQRSLDEGLEKAEEESVREVTTTEDVPLIDKSVGTIHEMDIKITLPELGQELETEQDQMNEEYKKTVTLIKSLLVATEAKDLDMAMNSLNTVRSLIDGLKAGKDILKQHTHNALLHLSSELVLRPDLKLEPPLDRLPEGIPLEEFPQVDTPMILQVIEYVLEYDKKKELSLKQLVNVRSSLSELHEELSIWEKESTEEIEVFPQPELEETELTLEQVNVLLEEAKKGCKQFENRLLKYREFSVNRIKDMINRLTELDTPLDMKITEDLGMGDLVEAKMTDWPGERIKVLEEALVAAVNAQLALIKSASVIPLAKDLLEKWDDNKLVDLLDCLSKENRDIEAFLLLLASNSVYTRTTSLELSRKIVSNLLSGLGQISSKAQPFELLNLLAPGFIHGWEATDPISKAELCVVYLAARSCGPYRFPVELLWQLAYEWPDSDMENWNRLWEIAIMDNPLQIDEDASEGQKETLEQARIHAEEMFIREHGHYLRIRGVKSNRHRALLGDEIMPVLHNFLEKIRKLDTALSTANANQAPGLLQKLEKVLNQEISAELQEDAIIDMYEKGVSEGEIADSEAFFRRSSVRLLQECANSILTYGQELVDFWCLQTSKETTISQAKLQAELEAISSLSTLGQVAFKQIIQSTERDWPEFNPEGAEVQAKTQIEHEIVGQGTYLIRFPRLVCELTRDHLGWEKTLALILEDLSDPLDHIVSGTMFLECVAPNHVLMLSQYLPLDLQKQAQSLKGEKEQEVKQFELELLQVGGNVDDMLIEQELGRWGLVIKTLRARLEQLKEVHKTKRDQQLKNSHQLRTEINELDNQIFEIKDSIPVDVFDLMEQGLALTRKTCSKEAFAQPIQAYIDEVRYRLEHKSWSLNELQNAYNALCQDVREEERPQFADLSAEKVLDLFDREEVRQLGLAPGDITLSAMGTRVDLLRNWLTVGSTSHIKNAELKQAERLAIQNLYSYFGKMMAMKRTLNPQGEPIVYEDPVNFAYMDLQHPKTAVLDNRCIFIALPGNPPTPKSISFLEFLIEEKEWLDYFFVFLFVPGCSPKLYERMQTSYRGSGLVIFDEPVILQMVLAEREARNPLGKLRPLMLNALEADNVDIFKINQLVDINSSIFVGRNREIERIASSGDNYTIYGGRRIGKSSVLFAIEKLLKHRGAMVVSHSFEGQTDCSDDQTAVVLSQLLNLEGPVHSCDDLKMVLQSLLESNPDLNLIILLDEIDRYIESNPERHVLIETLRSVSERYGSHFRVVISGFMHLYDCLIGRGPYTPASDPWGRMLNDTGPLRNLIPANAESIVKEGFLNILGWHFENRGIPQMIVVFTGGHPAFVQYFCMKVQQRVGMRGDKLVKSKDIEAVFADSDPEQSFIAYVRKTLEMNLDPVGHYLILMMAVESSKSQGFTFGQMYEYASSDKVKIPEFLLRRSIERLKVTSVIREISTQVYEFSVPDYPSILMQLGEPAHMDHLEHELEEYLQSVDHEQG